MKTKVNYWNFIKKNLFWLSIFCTKASRGLPVVSTYLHSFYLLLTHLTHSSPLFDILKPYHNLFYTFSRFSTYSQPTPPIFTYSYFFLNLFTHPSSPFCILNPHSLSQALPQLLPTPLAHFRVFFISLPISSHFHCF